MASQISMFRKSFRKLFGQEKPRVYLGTLAVVPRTDIKRYLDQWGILDAEEPDTQVRQMLEEIFTLPRPVDIDTPKNSDLLLDVIIPKFQLGEFLSVEAGRFWFPLISRPKVTVISRLSYLKSGKTMATFHATQKMPWRDYLKRVIRPESLLGFGTLFGRNDLEYLLNQACQKILLKMIDKI